MSTNKKIEENKDWISIVAWIIIILLTITGFIVLISFLIKLTNEYTVHGESEIMLDKTGQVGDFIGGLVGSLWAFAGIILFYLALRLQRKEFISQREELRQQKNEFQINRITNIIYKQLEILEKKKSQLLIKVPKSNETLKGQDVIDKLPFRYSLKFTPSTDFKKLSKEQKELLTLWQVACSDSKIKEYVNSLLKYIKITTGLIKQAKSQKDSISEGDVKQLLSIAYENIQNTRELVFLNLLRVLNERDKDASKSSDATYIQYLENEISKINTLTQSLNMLRNASV